MSRTSTGYWETANTRIEGTDVLHLEVCGEHVLVLSRTEPVLDLLDNRSAVRYDRADAAEYAFSLLLMSLPDTWNHDH